MRTKFACVVSGIALLTACATSPEPAAPPPSLEDAVSSHGYVPLALPSSAIAPGAIVRLVHRPDGSSTFERVSSLATCGATSDETTVTSGEIPALGGKRTFNLQGSATLAVLQQQIGLTGNQLREFTAKFDSSHDAMLDEFKLDAWRSRIAGNAAAGLPPICAQLVSDTPADLFIVTRGLSFSGGEITARVTTNAGVTVPQLFHFLTSLGVTYQQVGESQLTFAGPVYFGVRNIYYAGGKPMVITGGKGLGETEIEGGSQIEGSALQALLGGPLSVAPVQ
ncbi:MAG TPA: hypothetical protein VG943_01050 [Caulobacterales bacterium]|nr:hypothetical protein [Caulobacterales bacterium]